MSAPDLSDMLLEAEKPRVRRDPLPNQITFPIYREEQWDRLKSLLWRRGLHPSAWRFNARTGIELGFADEGESVLAKMAFDPR